MFWGVDTTLKYKVNVLFSRAQSSSFEEVHHSLALVAVSPNKLQPHSNPFPGKRRRSLFVVVRKLTETVRKLSRFFSSILFVFIFSVSSSCEHAKTRFATTAAAACAKGTAPANSTFTTWVRKWYRLYLLFSSYELYLIQLFSVHVLYVECYLCCSSIFGVDVFIWYMWFYLFRSHEGAFICEEDVWIL